MINCVAGVSKTTPSFSDSLGGIIGYAVILMAIIYYSDGHKARSAKGKAQGHSMFGRIEEPEWFPLNRTKEEGGIVED